MISVFFFQRKAMPFTPVSARLTWHFVRHIHLWKELCMCACVCGWVCACMCVCGLWVVCIMMKLPYVTWVGETGGETYIVNDRCMLFQKQKQTIFFCYLYVKLWAPCVPSVTADTWAMLNWTARLIEWKEASVMLTVYQNQISGSWCVFCGVFCVLLILKLIFIPSKRSTSSFRFAFEKTNSYSILSFAVISPAFAAPRTSYDVTETMTSVYL